MLDTDNSAKVKTKSGAQAAAREQVAAWRRRRVPLQTLGYALLDAGLGRSLPEFFGWGDVLSVLAAWAQGREEE